MDELTVTFLPLLSCKNKILSCYLYYKPLYNIKFILPHVEGMCNRSSLNLILTDKCDGFLPTKIIPAKIVQMKIESKSMNLD